MTAPKPEKKEVSQATIDMSKRIQPKLVIDPKTGQTTVEGDPFIETLPETLNAKIVKEVDQARKAFTEGAYHAFGEATIKVMSKDAKLQKTNANISLGGNTDLGLSGQRDVEFLNPSQPGEKINRSLQITAKITTTAKTAEAKRVIDQIVEEADKRLTKSK